MMVVSIWFCLIVLFVCIFSVIVLLEVVYRVGLIVVIILFLVVMLCMNGLWVMVVNVSCEVFIDVLVENSCMVFGIVIVRLVIMVMFMLISVKWCLWLDLILIRWFWVEVLWIIVVFMVVDRCSYMDFLVSVVLVVVKFVRLCYSWVDGFVL